MSSLVPVVKGSVKIEIIKDGIVTYVQETPNTLVLEAPKIMLGNIIAPSLTGNSTVDFPNSTSQQRPTISAGGSEGPSSKLAVTYLSLGYVEGTDIAENVVVSAEDQLPLGATLYVTKLLTGADIEEYSVKFGCSFQVTADTANRNYFEAALLCPALSDNANSIPPDPEAENTLYSQDDQVMFAHQTHNVIQASVDSTISYTWTITMQDPSSV